MLFTTTYTEWGLFAAGFGIGVSSTQAENIQNECIAGIFSSVDAAWNVYYYMDKYMKTEEEVHMAWGITYLVKGFETLYNVDCSNIETEVNDGIQTVVDWIDDALTTVGLKGQLPIAINVEGAIVKQDATYDAEFTEMVFEAVYEVLTDFSLVIGAVEIYINSSSALETFQEGKYFQAGYFLGSGGFGFVWTAINVLEKYIIAWNNYYA